MVSEDALCNPNPAPWSCASPIAYRPPPTRGPLNQLLPRLFAHSSRFHSTPPPQNYECTLLVPYLSVCAADDHSPNPLSHASVLEKRNQTFRCYRMPILLPGYFTCW